MDHLVRSLREAPVVKRGAYDYLVHPVTDGIPLVEPALLREIADDIAAVIDLDAVDKVVTPEAMGIHLATALALGTDLPFVIVRKRSYGLDGEVAVHQRTGYAEGELYVNNVHAGDRVLFLDDVYSTGGTLEAVCSALLDIGAEVVAAVVIIRRGNRDPDLPVPVTSLVTVDVVDGEVVVEDGRPDDAG